MVDLNENDIRMLQIIRRNPGCTKSELANKIKIPWSTAHSSIKKLQNENLIFEQSADEQHSTNKYRAGIFVIAGCEYYIGISVGCSQTKVVVLGFDFEVPSISKQFEEFQEALLAIGFTKNENNMCQWCQPTPDTIQDLIRILVSICEKLVILKQEQIPIVAVNFTFPGHIDFYKQRIITTDHLCNNSDYVRNANIARLITASMHESMLNNGIQVYIDHNAKSSAVAEKEYRFVQFSENKDLIILYLGKGIGMSLIIDDKLYRDKDNMAGQFGKVKIWHNDNYENLEDVLARYIFKDEIHKDAKHLKTWLDDEKNSDKKSMLASILARALSSVIHVVGINDIVFSGKFNEILSSIEFELTQELSKLDIDAFHLHHSYYGEYSAATGAAMSCFNNIYGVEYFWKI